MRKATYSLVVLFSACWLSICLSVLPHRTTPLPLDWYVWNLIILYFSKICRENSNFIKNRTIITGTLREEKYTLLILSHSFILRTRNILEKFIEKIKTNFMFRDVFFENHVFREIMSKNIVESDRALIPMWSMRIPRWITKSTDSHSQYVILIACQKQQCLHEVASVLLSYSYTACFVIYIMDTWIVVQF